MRRRRSCPRCIGPTIGICSYSAPSFASATFGRVSLPKPWRSRFGVHLSAVCPAVDRVLRGQRQGTYRCGRSFRRLRTGRSPRSLGFQSSRERCSGIFWSWRRRNWPCSNPFTRRTRTAVRPRLQPSFKGVLRADPTQGVCEAETGVREAERRISGLQGTRRRRGRLARGAVQRSATSMCRISSLNRLHS